MATEPWSYLPQTVSPLAKPSGVESFALLPQFINHELAPFVYNEVLPLCKRYWSSYYECYYPRISCVCTDKSFDPSLINYDTLSVYPWTQVPVITKIRDFIQQTLNLQFDYCLVHIYRNGQDSISWHNDKEALNSDVVSVSFGASRKFRLRPIHDTKGWSHQYILNSGDVMWMKSGCQQKYKHHVPKESKVKEWRINLTFRKLEKN